MSYVFASSPCFGCKTLFSYNPARVPVVVLDGERHPICEMCVARANPSRVANGLPPIHVLPGAYEPADEGEVFG